MLLNGIARAARAPSSHFITRRVFAATLPQVSTEPEPVIERHSYILGQRPVSNANTHIIASSQPWLLRSAANPVCLQVYQSSRASFGRYHH